MTYSFFLTAVELRELTGFVIKSRQIEQLRTMGIPFRINGCGKPVVTRSSVEEKSEQQPVPQRLLWQSAMMQQDRKAA